MAVANGGLNSGPARASCRNRATGCSARYARPPLNIPLDHPGLRLLQRLRDEAHRFANTYNAELRSKRIRESLLDDFPGLGPVRRAALMDWFGSIERLRGANAAEISEVKGFGPRMAAELQLFLAGTKAH